MSSRVQWPDGADVRHPADWTLSTLLDDERAALEVRLDGKRTPIDEDVGRRLEKKGCIQYDYTCDGRAPCGRRDKHAHMRMTWDGLEMYALDTQVRRVVGACRS